MNILLIGFYVVLFVPLIYLEIIYPCIVYNNIRKALNIYRNKQKFTMREKEGENNDCQ